ncbi:DNA-directed RNA polymerase subunit alpha [bacterium CPR1]|nr:DNA-directed RNA polymerase subunit alpha [bacterium CPR1]
MLDTILAQVANPVEFAEPRVVCVGENKFIIEPLERGFGITLGNSLRRVLLSALVGAAVTHVRIDGVLHEFSTLDGVLEDTTEMILNLKKLKLKLMTDKRKLLRLESSGPGVVTAADILPDPEVEILNPDLQIATVEDTRVGQRTDFDRLNLEVWTDNSLKPYEAISQAAQVLQDQLSLFTNLQPPSKVDHEHRGPESEMLDTPIEDLALSVRSMNCLKRAGIRTVGELLTYSEEDVMKLKNFGQKSLDEIKDKLMERNLSLQPSTPD